MTTQEIELPVITFGEVRRGEGMLLVMQDNENKSLIINTINEPLEQLLGYVPGELVGRKLETVLGQKTAALLAEDLEYTPDAPDFGEWFSRMREVKFRRRTGEEFVIHGTLSRMMSQGMNACFQLLIPNEQEVTAASKLRNFLTLNLEGRKELDEATGLPNHKTAKEFLPLLRTYLSESKMDVVFAVIRLDRHKKSLARYGKDACAKLLVHASHCCQATFRAEDMVFALSDHTLGVVLFDISRESARVVLNRLRWRIRSHRIEFGGKSDFSISACVGFDMLNAENAETVFEQCEKTMSNLDANERNALVELGAA